MYIENFTELQGKRKRYYERKNIPNEITSQIKSGKIVRKLDSSLKYKVVCHAINVIRIYCNAK